MNDVAPGTALRDSMVAIGFSVVLCSVLAVAYAGPTLLGVVAAAIGIAVVLAAGASVLSRAGRWSGPADRVTLGRTVLIGGCATIAVLVVAGELPSRTWWLTLVAGPALLLDAVDGLVARRTGTASPAGARLDMEMDAALLLVLSVIAVSSLGPWALVIGGMRYAFVAAAWFRPWLMAPLQFSQFRRVVAAIQGAALALALAPVVPVGPAQVVLAIAVVLLVVSFGRDVRTLEREARVARTQTAAPVQVLSLVQDPSPAQAPSPTQVPIPAQAPIPVAMPELLRDLRLEVRPEPRMLFARSVSRATAGG